MKITTEDIQVGFHARQILKGISIESKDKELVGIIGPNGSGKSTLLKCIIPFQCFLMRCTSHQHDFPYGKIKVVVIVLCHNCHFSGGAFYAHGMEFFAVQINGTCIWLQDTVDAF